MYIDDKNVIYSSKACRDKVISSNPVINDKFLTIYYYYLKERNEIYKKKEVYKSEYPWTDDKILRNNSFTCCKRWLDKTSRWLIDNISTNYRLSVIDRVWRTILFRSYNKIETAVMIGLDKDDFWDRIEKSMDILDEYPNDPYTRAYKVINLKYAYRDISPKGHDCWKSSLLWYINKLKDSEYGKSLEGILNDSDSIINWIKKIRGFGEFISYQIFIDFTYITELQFTITEEDYVYSGPGCSAGLNMLFYTKDGLKDSELLYWIRDNIDSIFRKLDMSYNSYDFFDYLPERDRRWTVQDLENSFCEFSKYVYIKEGRHRKVRRYKLT